MTRETTTAAGWKRHNRALALFDALMEFLQLLIRLISRIFGWPVRAMRHLARGGSRSGQGGPHTAERERAQRRAEMTRAEPASTDELQTANWAPRLVPVMKEYLRTTDLQRRAGLVKRLAQSQAAAVPRPSERGRAERVPTDPI